VDKKPWPAKADLSVQVHPHIGVDIEETIEGFTIAKKTCHEERKVLPLAMFEANPPAGNKILLIRLEIVSPTAVAMTFEGRLWNLRHRFDAAGIPLTGEGATPRVRFVNEGAGDLSQVETSAKLLSIFGNSVFRGHVCYVRMDSAEPPVDTPAHAFLLQLRALDHVYFAT
jgi:hypothetical protein